MHKLQAPRETPLGICMRQRDSSWYPQAPRRLILVLESAANSAFGAGKRKLEAQVVLENRK
jgi:hypothetical protein